MDETDHTASDKRKIKDGRDFHITFSFLTNPFGHVILMFANIFNKPKQAVGYITSLCVIHTHPQPVF